MNKEILVFNNNSDIFEKLILILTVFLPISLCLSIFIAELFASIIGLITLVLILYKKKLTECLSVVRNPMKIILFFYFIVLVSLIFSSNFKLSFLPSFFYFRYILFSLGIFYLFYKYEISIKIISISLLSTLGLIFIDSIYDLLKINQIFGLGVEENRIGKPTANIVTSFFGEEKKLGSFIVRLLPFITSIVIISNIKILENNFFKKLSIELILLIVAGIIIFLTSERTAMFLFIFFFITSLRVLPKRLLIISSLSFMMIILSLTQKDTTKKFINATLFQFQIIETYSTEITNFDNLSFSNIKYISDVHEKLLKAGIEIFKESPFTGSGVKTFEIKCNDLKKRNPVFICSTHPHNTYIQIFSDVGFFGGVTILFIFLYILYLNIKIFFRKNLSNLLKSFYLLNLGIIINLMPFIPSGSFFNNWMNLVIYLPVGYWLYLYSKIKKSEINL